MPSVWETIKNSRTEIVTVIGSCLFIILTVYIYNKNPGNFVTNYGGYYALLSLICLFFFMITIYFIQLRLTFFGDTPDAPSIGQFLAKIGLFIGFIIGFIVLIYIIFWLLRNVSILSKILTGFLTILIIVGALGLIYLLLKPKIDRLRNNSNATGGRIINFLIDLILYVPCLFLDLVQYIKHEYKITPRIVWIVLLIEIILISLRFLVPYIFKYVITHEGVHLLNDPIYTNKLTTLGSFEDLNKTTTEENPYNYHYSLSFWVWLNPQSPASNGAYTRYTSLLNYGNKPNILYNAMKNKLRVEVQLKGDTKEIIYETSELPFQKWNHIVINYDGGTLDVFINNELVASKGEIAPFLTYETVTSGASPGIHGGICNVTYYDKILSKDTISWIYNSLKMHTNPTLI